IAARVLTSISASLSMFGALVIILTYFAWKDIRTVSRQILVFISIADFLTAFGNMMSALWRERSDSDTPCVVQSFITTCSSLWSFFWTTFLALFLNVMIVKRRPVLAEKAMFLFHLFAWGLPLVITITAATWKGNKINGTSYRGVLGNSKDQGSAGWCWIRHDLPKKEIVTWMLVTGKAWEIAAYILITLLYFILKYYIHQEHFTPESYLEAAMRADRKLTFVPVIFLLLRIWGTTRFLLYAFGDTTHNETWMVYLQGIGDSGQGFANFLLFCCLTERFKTRLWKAFMIWFECCRRWKSPGETSSHTVY
ncbi:predicted protein, partial [Nematostella vectensis]